MYFDYNCGHSFSGKHFSARLCLLLVLTFFTTEGSSWSQNYRPKQQLSGAVVSNAVGCAEIGRDIMAQGGNIIDTAIATAFCEGVTNPTTMGLGGGFIATIFDKASGKVIAFNARETAPAAATENMFNGNETLSVVGGLAVAVPSELKGYWQLYKQYGGKVSWWKLIVPAIRLCRNGIPMNNLTNKFVKLQEKLVRADPGLKAIFINPETDQVYEVGELYKRPKLANTLRIIAREGGLALHRGSLSKNFVKDIQDQGGIITEKDLRNYKPEIINPVTTNVAQKDVYSFPLPASGSLIIYILNILENYVNSTNPVSTLNVQRLTESLKFAYAERSKLGDRHFVEGIDALIANLTSKEYAKETRTKIFDNKTFNDPAYYGFNTSTVEDHGTANICVWGLNGDGIVLTSSINYVLGAGFASKSTDIILNNSMDDFSSPGITNTFGIPPSPANFIRPGKRPMSSMAPSIILDKNKNLFMLAGGSGGSKITSSVVQVMINRLYYNFNIQKSSDDKRIHHQLLPMNLYLEDDWLLQNEDIVTQLIEYGHNVTYISPDGFSAVSTISVDNSSEYQITAVFDKRRPGSVAYFKLR